MLNPDRNPILESIDYFMLSTGDAGRIAFQYPVASGSQALGNGLDSTNNKIEYVNAAGHLVSGRKPVGMVLQPVVNIDFSRQQLNQYNNERQVNSKVLVGVIGTWSTNCWGASQLSTGVQLPATVYAGPSGTLWTDNYSGSGWPAVGKALTGKDSNGFAKVLIDCAGN